MKYVVAKYKNEEIIYDGYTKQGVTVVFFVLKNKIRGPPLIN